jgi:hypothetical protein
MEEARKEEALTEPAGSTAAGTLASVGAGILMAAPEAGRACRPLKWAGGAQPADE